MSQPNATGVVVADRSGQCIDSCGQLGSSTSGRVRSIYDSAASIAAALGEVEPPIVVIESESSTTTVATSDGLYVAVMTSTAKGST